MQPRPSDIRRTSALMAKFGRDIRWSAAQGTRLLMGTKGAQVGFMHAYCMLDYYGVGRGALHVRRVLERKTGGWQLWDSNYPLDDRSPSRLSLRAH